jgi:hypothetical protein
MRYGACTERFAEGDIPTVVAGVDANIELAPS